MTITESLAVLRRAQTLGHPLEVQLACSFTPLHLKTLLAAHLQNRTPQRRVSMAEGTFGDLVGSIESASHKAALAIALEWQDLDPRLKYREGGAWGRALTGDLLSTARTMLGRIERAVTALPPSVLVAISLPTLPLLPVFHPPGWQAAPEKLLLERELIDFAGRMAGRPQVRIASTEWLDARSPAADRLDLKSDLLIGFPYTVPHADRLAEALALCLAPRQALKGIITDLDNTFWSGLVGEAGADAVRWDTASRYYLHGIYQKLLGALADEGVLIGIASKNDPQVVSEALKRSDLLIAPNNIFPVEVHWSPKSESVARILKVWNVGADSVAFVDDTPLELAEVASAHPGILCLPFPTGDYAGVWRLLQELRDLCGKSRLSEEDALRLASIRGGAQFQEQAAAGVESSDEFLRSINAVITFDLDASPQNARTLELVNKTNQFNLNGARLTESEWAERMQRSGAFLATVKYEDKFGALGTIAVVQGAHRPDATLAIEAWVMSCRAFSRRIEHQTLKTVFERFRPAEIRCEFAPTPKNGPLQEFFATILKRTPDRPFTFTPGEFEAVCPALPHRVEETTGVTVNG